MIAQVATNAFNRFFGYAGGLSLMLADSLRFALTLRIRPTEVLRQAFFLGVQSWPIITLTSLFTGLVISLEAASTAVSFGLQSYIGGSVAFATFRELGPMLSAVVFAGRAGAAITASLGSMKVTEQIEALQSMGSSPVKVLVTPRLLACLLMLPLLTIFADIVGIVAGYIMAWDQVHLSQYQYFHSVQVTVDNNDFLKGLFKAAVFAVIVAMVACYEGFNTTGGADGVGKSTTQAVVASIILIFAANFALSFLMFQQ